MRVCHWRAELENISTANILRSQLAQILTPNVLKPLPEPLQLSGVADALEKWLKDRHSESDVFTVRGIAKNELLGVLILAAFSDAKENTTVHTGYLFAESAWGKGYATEMLRGLVARASLLDFGQGKFSFLAGVAQSNSASMRVLEKSGFNLDTRPSGSDNVFFEYTIT